MLTPVYDLNNALLSYILCGFNGYTSTSGWMGINVRIDHDISILIPELFSRMFNDFSNPDKLIEEGALEKVNDIEFEGRYIESSRLGYRITPVFVFNYLGKIFDEPQMVFSETVLKPELADMRAFAEGVENIVESQKKAASMYFEDNSLEKAIEPLKALINVMVHGHYNGLKAKDPDFRMLFTREYVLKSDWYQKRLETKQSQDKERWGNHIDYMSDFMAKPVNLSIADEMNIEKRIKKSHKNLDLINSSDYIKRLIGTIGGNKL
jgi:hypothetical protein